MTPDPAEASSDRGVVSFRGGRDGETACQTRCVQKPVPQKQSLRSTSSDSVPVVTGWSVLDRKDGCSARTALPKASMSEAPDFIGRPSGVTPPRSSHGSSSSDSPDSESRAMIAEARGYRRTFPMWLSARNRIAKFVTTCVKNKLSFSRNRLGYCLLPNATLTALHFE